MNADSSIDSQDPSLKDSADELIPFREDDAPAPDGGVAATWRVLIVDDDPEVHAATRFALGGLEILGRPLELLYAHSASGAEALLREAPDIAVILLDVVMEREDAGLRLVEKIRGEMGLDEPRIVLRTGQPGFAPELPVITRYDINDYRTKSELTQTRLVTTLTTAIRGHHQIRAVNAGRRGLRRVIDATSDLLTRQGLRGLADGLMTQIGGLFHLPPDGLVAVEAPKGQDGVLDPARTRVIAATGRYGQWLDRPLSEVGDGYVVDAILDAIAQGCSVRGTGGSALYFSGGEHQMAAYVGADAGELDHDLLSLFCRNISLCSDNLLLLERFREHAFRDELTGLPNRLSFVQEVQQQLAAPGERPAIAILDVDHFNSVVETIGHQATDELLRVVAERLRNAFAEEPVCIARITADAFGLLGTRDRLSADRLQALLSHPCHVADLEIALTATIGFADLGQHFPNASAALSAAHVALKRAKSRHRSGFQHYTASMSQEVRERARMLQDLQQALKGAEFFLELQPQFALPGRGLIGFETLLRWRNGQGELIPPAYFIPIAERSGMMVSLGAWILRTACDYQRRLEPRCPGAMVAVNVSAAQLRDPGFPALVAQTLSNSGARAERMEIEITETMAMDDMTACLGIVDRLKAQGLRVALDDFGTGFSSLSYLSKLQPDRLKIDRSFISELCAAPESARIVQTVVQLGRELQIDVLAEGVETEDQAQRLAAMGCTSMQGFLYGQPMALDVLLDWLPKVHGSV